MRNVRTRLAKDRRTDMAQAAFGSPNQEVLLGLPLTKVLRLNVLRLAQG